MTSILKNVSGTTEYILIVFISSFSYFQQTINKNLFAGARFLSSNINLVSFSEVVQSLVTVAAATPCYFSFADFAGSLGH